MHTDLTPDLLTTLRSLAAQVAREAGAQILQLRARGVSVSATKSSSVDIVTHADHVSEEFIVRSISMARPNDGIVGEEGHTVEGTSGITWVIDPIDGTVNYLYGIPAFCVSIAATVEDDESYADGRRPVVAAVFNPSTREMFTAGQGLGAELNGTTISVAMNTDLATSLIATGFGYTAERRVHQASILQRLIPEVRDIRRMGSAAYDLCLVASGRIDAYYEIGIQPWDWAAAALIVTEAGAITLGANSASRPGTPLFIAGNPHLAHEIQRIVGNNIATHPAPGTEEFPKPMSL